MKQEDKKYEEWLTEIKNKQPILENPEELTAAILNKITDNAPKKKKIRYRLRLVMRRQRRNLSRMFSLVLGYQEPQQRYCSFYL